MSFLAFLAIGVGAAAGAWLRWGFGMLLNSLFPTVPLGTLAANLLGGYLMGIALQLLIQNTALPPEFRLGITTGFLGGLTTFSTFCAETVTLLLREQYGWTLAILLSHVLGSIGMTLMGTLTIQLVSRRMTG